MIRIACVLVPALIGCASNPEEQPADEGPGPMKPLEPDRELDAAAPIDVDDQPTMETWLAERVAAANAGVRERVRLPIIRRSAGFGCDCPPFAVARDTDNGPFYWIRVVDLTSRGLPPAMRRDSEGGVRLWVDGRFTGRIDNYRSTDEGGTDVATPVFEVLRYTARTTDEEALARVVRED